MGTVVPRKRSDGSTGYQAQLLIKRAGKIVHRENRTFDRRQAAAAWLEKREASDLGGQIAKAVDLPIATTLQSPRVGWSCRERLSREVHRGWCGDVLVDEERPGDHIARP